MCNTMYATRPNVHFNEHLKKIKRAYTKRFRKHTKGTYDD